MSFRCHAIKVAGVTIVATSFRSFRIFGLGRQSTPLVITEPQPPCTELLAQNPVLFAKVVDRMNVLLVHPTSDGNEEQPEWIKDARHFVRIIIAIRCFSP
jgi:hypothetical protein